MSGNQSSCTNASSGEGRMDEMAGGDNDHSAEKCSVSATADVVKFSLSEFNKDRKIIIKNVPPCTYEEVKDFLHGFGVSNMSISKKSRHAIVTLLRGEEAEDAVAQCDGKEMLGTQVEVALYPHEAMLCVAHLPMNINDEEFKAMVEPFGAIEKCFLMRNQASGKSQGYGFVEFMHNKENIDKVRSLLDGKKVGSCTLRCQFTPDTLLKFADLRSKCLLVDHLPQDYKNNSELKSIFSRIVTPVYCQVCVHKGEGMGFGVVEYSTPEEAVDSQAALNGHQIHTNSIRVSFCMPGRAASEISNMVLSSQLLTGHHGKQSLLPNPILPGTPQRSLQSHASELASPIVKQLLANSAQGDAVLEKFQAILQQLQQMQKPQKPGLLGKAPFGVGDNNPLHNPNLQIALLSVLLATQVQSLFPGLLGSPAMQETLMTSLQQQITPVPPLIQKTAKTPPPAPLTAPLLGNPLIAQANAMLHCLQSQQPADSTSPLLPTPSSTQLTSPPAAANHSFNNFNDLLSTLSQASSRNTGGGKVSAPTGRGVDVKSSELKEGLLGDKPTQAGDTSSTASSAASSAKGLLPVPLLASDTATKGLLGEAPGNTAQLGLLGDAPVSRAQQMDLVSSNVTTGLLGEGPAVSPISTGLLGNAPMDKANDTAESSDEIVSQLNPLAPQFVPKSPGSKAMDAGDFLNGNEQLNMANPLLALYIESRIRDQLAEFQLGTQPIEPPTPPSMKIPSPRVGGKVPLLPHPTTPAPAPFSKTPGRRPPSTSWDPPPANSNKPPPLLGMAPGQTMPPKRFPQLSTPAKGGGQQKKQGLLGDTPSSDTTSKEAKPSLLPTPSMPAAQQTTTSTAYSSAYQQASPAFPETTSPSAFQLPGYYSQQDSSSNYSSYNMEQWQQQWQDYYKKAGYSPPMPEPHTPSTQALESVVTAAAKGDANTAAEQWEYLSRHYAEHYQRMCQQYMYQCNAMYSQMYYQQQQQLQSGAATSTTSSTAGAYPSHSTAPPATAPPALPPMPTVPPAMPPLPPPPEQPPLPPPPPLPVSSIPMPPNPDDGYKPHQKRAHLLPSPDASSTYVQQPYYYDNSKKRKHDAPH